MRRMIDEGTYRIDVLTQISAAPTACSRAAAAVAGPPS
jgi:DNA-binding FrmR family transcriptional regulator